MHPITAVNHWSSSTWCADELDERWWKYKALKCADESCQLEMQLKSCSMHCLGWASHPRSLLVDRAWPWKWSPGRWEDGSWIYQRKNLLVLLDTAFLGENVAKIGPVLHWCYTDVLFGHLFVLCNLSSGYAKMQRCCLQAWICCIQELERLQDILSFADDGAFYAGEESEFGPVPVAKIKETIGNIGFKWFKCIVHWEGLQYPIWQDWQVTTFCLSGCKWGKSWQ